MVGFSDLDEQGYIDMLFVSPEFGRRGVASRLLDEIETRGRTAGLDALTVSAKTGLGCSAIYARMTLNPKRPNDYDPTFPKPIKIGARSVAWIESEIDQWIYERIAQHKAAIATMEA
mgnify:CR=1 FL=1